MAAEPWDGLVKARAELLNALGDMNSIDVVTLSTVRDAIDSLIQARIAESQRPELETKTEQRGMHPNCVPPCPICDPSVNTSEEQK